MENQPHLMAASLAELFLPTAPERGGSPRGTVTNEKKRWKVPNNGQPFK